MEIPWTVHIPQALQQHGAGRKSRHAAESDRLADLKAQGSRPNAAEDAASRITPADQPSML
jgi:hypothetical protein